MYPDSEGLAFEVKDDGSEIHSDINSGNSHKDDNDAICCNPIIDDPSPNPRDE